MSKPRRNLSQGTSGARLRGPRLTSRPDRHADLAIRLDLDERKSIRESSSVCARLQALPDGGFIALSDERGEPGPREMVALRYDAAGHAEPIFGRGGEALIQGLEPARAEISDLSLGADGGLVAAAEVKGRLGLLRVAGRTADGSLSWRTSTGPPLGSDFLVHGHTLAREPGGGYLVGAYSAGRWIVTRWLSKGRLDPGFGDGGVVEVPFLRKVLALQVAADGSILGGGGDVYFSRVVELTADGRRVASFGRDGLASGLPLPESLTAIGLDRHGRIVLTGVHNKQASIARLLPHGAPDLTFAHGGSVRTEIAPSARSAFTDLRIEPDVITKNPLSEGGNWAALQWDSSTTGHNTGQVSGGWGPYDAFSTVNGAYWHESFADAGTGDAVTATLAYAPGLVERYFALWLNAPSPGTVKSGYELRFYESAAGTYTVTISRWSSGTKTVLATQTGFAFAAGGKFALVEKAKTVSAWTAPASGDFTQLLSATDATYASGRPAVEGSGSGTRMTNIRAGVLPAF